MLDGPTDLTFLSFFFSSSRQTPPSSTFAFSKERKDSAIARLTVQIARRLGVQSSRLQSSTAQARAYRKVTANQSRPELCHYPPPLSPSPNITLLTTPFTTCPCHRDPSEHACQYGPAPCWYETWPAEMATRRRQLARSSSQSQCQWNQHHRCSHRLGNE